MKNCNIERVTQLYFLTAREMAIDDLDVAQTVTGLPPDFLALLRDMDLESIAKMVEKPIAIPFQPRIPPHLLLRLFKFPAEINDAVVLTGVNTDDNASY